MYQAVALLLLPIIHRLSAQCNNYENRETCDSDVDCEWDTDSECHEGGPNCCLDYVCPMNGVCNIRKNEDCCEASSVCGWISSPLCYSQDASLPVIDCCVPSTAQPTTTTEPTTANPTTPIPEPIMTSEQAKSANKPKRPTPRPTMHSAEKWEMIHPAYDGGDGELLWHVYYGDFSNDERFDEFREKEMWDSDEIKLIIGSGVEFEKRSEVVFAKSKLIKHTKVKYGGWIILAAILCICAFAIKYRKDMDLFNKYESKPLLRDDGSFDGYEPIS